MAKMITDILGAPEPLFSINLEQLERACGRPNVDIRLASEMCTKIRGGIRALGLDPKDTTARELYHGLRNLAQLHEQFLARRLGGTDAHDVADMLPRIEQFVRRQAKPNHGWFMKTSVARKMLKSTPPKKVMKALGYRSVESMLKHEAPGALFAASRLIENEQWLEGFMAKYRTLTPGDFESRSIEIIRPDNKRWQRVVEEMAAKRHHNVVQVKETGTILILPLPVKRLAGVTLTVTLMLLHAVNEIRMYSAHAKLQQVRPDFGRRLAKGLLKDEGYHAQIMGHSVHWRVVQRHFGDGSHQHPETFEPHLQAEDLAWSKAEETLYRLEPALHFWHDMDYVSLMAGDGKPVSFNLMDVSLNMVNQLPYEKRLYAHAVSGLWNELYVRYLDHPGVAEQVLKQFDGSWLDSEQFAIGLQGKLA